MAQKLEQVERMLRNPAKSAERGQLNPAGARVFTPEQVEPSRLRVENARLRMECEIAKKSDDVLREGCAARYGWIDAQRKTYRLPAMRTTLAVSASGYQAWKRAVR